MGDIHYSTLGNAYLQRHLLAVQTHSLEHAVRVGNKYLQIKHTSNLSTLVRQEEQEDYDIEIVNQIQPEQAKAFEALYNEFKLQSEQVMQLTTERELQNTAKEEEEVMRCWGSNKEGYIRKNMPLKSWRPKEPAKYLGSGEVQARYQEYC